MTRANQLTKSIVTWLNLNGYVAWRNNNGGVWDPTRNTFRKQKDAKLGVFDVIGFRKSDGKHIEVEVKVGRDRLSVEQYAHLCELNKCGAIGLVAQEFGIFVVHLKNLETGKPFDASVYEHLKPKTINHGKKISEQIQAFQNKRKARIPGFKLKAQNQTGQEGSK